MYNILSDVIEKYQNLPKRAKAAIWFFVCALLQRGINVITLPIFTRILTTSDYGKLSVYNSWLGIVTIFVTLNLNCGVYIQGVVKHEDNRYPYTSSMEGLCLTIVICWTVLYCFTARFWNTLFSVNTIQMFAMLITIWSGAVFGFWSYEQRLDLSYTKLVTLTLLISVAQPVLGVILVLASNDKVTARIVGVAAVEFCAYVWLFVGQMKRGRQFFNAEIWKNALRFNLPLIPHYLSMVVLAGADRIMIGKMISSSAAGIYSVAHSVALVMTLFSTALLQTLEPWLYRKIRDKRIADMAAVAHPAFVGIAMVNILLIAFAPEIIHVFAPQPYWDAILIIPVMAMSVFYMFLYTFFAVFGFYYERTTYIAMATVSGAVLNVLLNWIFIKKFGYFAAGYTTLVCYMVYALAHYMCMRKICNTYLNKAKAYSGIFILKVSFTFMFIGFAYLFMYKVLWIRYAATIAIFTAIAVNHKNIETYIKEILKMRKINNEGEI